MKASLLIRRYRFILFIFAGMIVGTVLFNIFIKLKITDADLLGNDYLAIYDSVRINGITVWKYVLKSRMKWMVFLVLAGITKIRIPIYALFTMAAGAGSGILISIMVLKYGLMGIAVFLISIFPQFIFYGIMYVLMLKIFIERYWIGRNEKKSYSCRNCNCYVYSRYIYGGFFESYSIKKNVYADFLRLNKAKKAAFFFPFGKLKMPPFSVFIYTSSAISYKSFSDSSHPRHGSVIDFPYTPSPTFWQPGSM